MLKELFPRAEVRVPSIRNEQLSLLCFQVREQQRLKEVPPGLTRGGRAEASTSSRSLSQDQNNTLGRKVTHSLQNIVPCVNTLNWYDLRITRTFSLPCPILCSDTEGDT